MKRGGGAVLVQSGISAKASSALQRLETRVPDQTPEFLASFLAELLHELPELFCPTTESEHMEKSAATQRKKRFALEPPLTGSINLRPSFPFWIPVLYVGAPQRTRSPSCGWNLESQFYVNEITSQPQAERLTSCVGRIVKPAFLASPL